MPNGGPRPDCVHCQHYRGRPGSDEGDPFCKRHDIPLAFPIYAFCSQHADFEPNGDWLEQEIGRRDLLQDDMMYMWLGGYEVPFIHVPLVSISEYAHWTQEMFLEARTALSEKRRDEDNKE